MIQFKHYSMSSDTIGTGDVVFKRYAATKSRFAQYVEGTLTELFPEDFGNITTLFSYTIIDDALKRIEFPDTLETIESYNLSGNSLKEIIFSKNISLIYGGVCPTVAPGCILDFSKAQKVPTAKTETSEGSSAEFFESSNITSIKVPQKLYNTWKSANVWEKFASKIIAV